MNASGIASKRDVAGQLVNLVSEGESGAPSELPRGAVCRGLYRVRQNVIRVEEGFEDRGAGACITGMGRGVGRVRGRSFGEGDRQQAGPML